MNKQIQLFLLPYAGGSSFSFFKLLRFLDKRIEIIPVEYSGRGNRSEEPLINCYRTFLLDVSSFINIYRRKDTQFAILGYSLGCLFTFDLCRLNLIKGKPSYLFFCSEGSLIQIGSENKHSLLSDDLFVDKMISLGGINIKNIDNKPLFDRVINFVKNDYDVFSQFRYYGDIINCDSSVIYSPCDEMCFNMEDWKTINTSNVKFFELGNNHFFLNDKYKELANIINNDLNGLL